MIDFFITYLFDRRRAMIAEVKAIEKLIEKLQGIEGEVVEIRECPSCGGIFRTPDYNDITDIYKCPHCEYEGRIQDYMATVLQ